MVFGCRVAAVCLVGLFVLVPLGGISQAQSGGGGGADQPSFFYRVTNGDTTEVLQALVDDRSAVEFYDYSSGDSSSHTGYEASDTASVFLWSGPEGKSLVFMADEANDGTGGRLKVSMAGLPAGASWVVKDDPNDAYTATSADWQWVSCCTDGGVIDLATTDAIALTLTFPIRSGISTYRVFGGPASDPQFVAFDPAESLVIETFQTPSAPGLSASSGPGVGEVSLVATPPEDDGGDPVTSYEFYRQSSPHVFQRIGSSADGTFVETGLDDGVTYSYHARAVNLGGSGDPSELVNETTFDLPGAPQDLAATASTTIGGSVSLGWTAPAHDGGTPITSYRVYRDGSHIATTTNLTYADVGLADGTAYEFTVSATNLVGEGATSEVVTVTTIAPPGPPTNVTVTAGPGAGELTLSWAPPVDDGGAPVTSYRVLRDGVDIGEHATGYTDQGLAEGTTYSYTVQARNAAGVGPGADAAGTTFARPSEPVGVSVSTPAAAGVLDVLWSPPADDGGTPVTAYRVYRDGVFVAETAAPPYRDSGLENGTWYAYTVAAVNLVGEGAASLVAEGETADVPEAPRNLTVESGGTLAIGRAELEWQVPADVNHAPVLQYTVYVGDSPDTLTPVYQTNQTAYRHQEGPLPPPLPQARHFAVTATNIVGEGPRTEVVCGVTGPYGPLVDVLCD